MTSRKSKKLLAISVLAILFISGLARYLYAGTAFLFTYMNAHPTKTEMQVEQLVIPGTSHNIPARMYSPLSSPKGTILLVHGVHADGYNEKRLIHFTSSLVKHGFSVLTPDISDLKNYRIVDQAVDDISTVTNWLLFSSDKITQNEKIGLWGISFAGGLCLQLAGTEEYKNRISTSFSFGGHGDLNDTIQYLMTGNTQTGHLAPHVYGQAVLVRRYAHLLVPKDQEEVLKDTVLQYLKGNYGHAKAKSQNLPPESRRFTKLIFAGDDSKLGSLLYKVVGAPQTSSRLSAIQNAPPTSSVFLLHGSQDNVIPPGESLRLAEWAEPTANSVSTLISPLINHVELEEDDTSSAWEYLRIIRFWSDLLQNT